MNPAPPVTRTRIATGYRLSRRHLVRRAGTAVLGADRGEALGEAVPPVGKLGSSLFAAQDRHRGPRRAGAELRRRDSPHVARKTSLLEDRLGEISPGAVAARRDVPEAE